MAVLYRHIRLDKNEPFYIGIGTTEKRAFEKTRRNDIWKKIVEKTDYEVEIIFDDLTWEQACKKEKEFIALYGRVNLCNGTLVNLTDGGEGTLGYKHTEEWKSELSKKRKGKKIKPHSEEQKLKMSLAKKGRKFTEEHKRKLSLSKIGNKNNLGKHLSEETKLKLSLSNRGQKRSEQTKENIRKAKQKNKDACYSL